jgi:hypothetical protein
MGPQTRPFRPRSPPFSEEIKTRANSHRSTSHTGPAPAMAAVAGSRPWRSSAWHCPPSIRQQSSVDCRESRQFYTTPKPVLHPAKLPQVSQQNYIKRLTTTLDTKQSEPSRVKANRQRQASKDAKRYLQKRNFTELPKTIMITESRHLSASLDDSWGSHAETTFHLLHPV